MNKKADSYVRFSSYNGQEKTTNNSGYSTNYQDTPRQPAAPPQQNTPNPPSQPTPPPASGRVREINCDGLYSLLTKENYQYGPDGKPMKILVKVHTDWCGPCKKVAPKVDELSNDPSYSNILFVGLDGDKILDHPLKKYINISAVPVFFGFVGGKQVDMIVGPDMTKIQKLCDGMANM
jgi:thioredoxin 1